MKNLVIAQIINDCIKSKRSSAKNFYFRGKLAIYNSNKDAPVSKMHLITKVEKPPQLPTVSSGHSNK